MITDIASLRVMHLRIAAVVEAWLILSALIIVDLLAGQGDRFWMVNPHPFWIPVLLVAAQYGALEGIVAALSASAALLIGNLPPLGFGEEPYAYVVNLTINPAMWLAAGLAIGELRSQADRRLAQAHEDLEHAVQREQKLLSAAERLATANRSLEERVAGQLRTVASLYEASRSVEQLGTGDVLIGISGLVRAGLNPKQYSVYLLHQSQLESVSNEGWTATDRFVRLFPSSSALFREIVAHRRFLCAATPQDQAILAGEGLLAGPIISAETGETIGMLKIESMNPLEFNRSAVESFRVMCQWIGTAFARARTFEHASSRSFAGSGGILSASAEAPLTQFLRSLARRIRFEFCIIHVGVHCSNELTTDAKRQLIHAARLGLHSALRQTDIACERGPAGLEFAVLAPACNHADAVRLAERIKVQIAQNAPSELRVKVSAIATPMVELAALEASA